MKYFFITIGILILLVGCNQADQVWRCDDVTCSTYQPPPEVMKMKVKIIRRDALKRLLDNRLPVILLDARRGKFDDRKRIPGAKSLHDKSSREKIARTIKDPNSLIVTYCTDKACPASLRLAKRLIHLGYQNVLDYQGGIREWEEAGYPIKKVRQ